MHFDMLVKLYELDDDWSFIKLQKEKGVIIKRVIGLEKHVISEWINKKFAPGWGSELERALTNNPISCYVAIKDKKLIGFACYDSTKLGFFGPTGVSEECRGMGTGKALLMACLLDMKVKGYGYAIIGAVGPAGFYTKAVGAVPIPDSWPGVYADLLTKNSL